MAIEILTVSLSDESIEAIARRVAQIVRVNAGIDLPGVDMAVTQSNPPSAQTPQPAAQPGFQQGPPPSQNSTPPDPWAQQTFQGNTPTAQPQAQPPQNNVPMCAHGPKRWIEAGFSKTTGKAYQGFYACPAPRGQQCPRS